MFQAYFGPACKTFYNIHFRVTIFSFGDLHLLYSTRLSEVIAIFLQLILFASAAVFFYSLFGLGTHSFSEGDNDKKNAMALRLCVEETNHLRNFWPVLQIDDIQNGFSRLYYYPRLFLLCL